MSFKVPALMPLCVVWQTVFFWRLRGASHRLFGRCQLVLCLQMSVTVEVCI